MSDANKRQHFVGLIDCPACKDAADASSCELCQGARVVAADLAVKWQVEHDSLPPSEKK